MLYPVLKPFKDKKDSKREYQLNDWYPRFNFETDENRVEELFQLGHIGKPEEVEEEQNFPKHVGGGWYELSNGERVQGKEEAIEAEKGD